MTQMGLEYMKMKESVRHNMADEGLRNVSNQISQQDANTRQYSASFEPQRVGAQQEQAHAATAQAGVARDRLSMDQTLEPRKVASQEKQAEASLQQAQASTSQAGTAAGKLELDKAYRERETQVKEDTVDVAIDKNQIQQLKNMLDKLSGGDAAVIANRALGGNEFANTVAGMNAIMSQILGNIKVGLK